MAHHEHDEDHGRQAERGADQENDSLAHAGEDPKNAPSGAPWDRGEYGGGGSYEGQGEYGGQGSSAQGEFPGQRRTQYDPQGLGEDPKAEGVGLQGGERFINEPEVVPDDER